MAQYFSHLNGLTLGNNWGDLIRLLDKTLATGVALPNLVTVSQETEENIRLQFVSNHNTMLLQLVELVGFLPEKYNSAFRVIGVPSTTELILRVGTVVASDLPTVRGAAKIQSLGYEIIFRDAGDVKRVYRAKNPTVQHPFIRVDESLASPDGTTGVYTGTYIKSAMVGLLGHMGHIDDFENPNVLQLPFDLADPAKNWKILGTGLNVQRGWSLWHWAWGVSPISNINASYPIAAGNRPFTVCGDADAFYFHTATTPSVPTSKFTYGCGLFESGLESDVIPNWFLSTTLAQRKASDGHSSSNLQGGFAFGLSDNTSRVFVTRYTPETPLGAHVSALPVMPDYQSGRSGFANSGLMPCMSIPLKDINNYLRGVFKHIAYNAKSENVNITTPRLANNSMYVLDTLQTSSSETGNGSAAYYLGELE